ncbi:LamG-like jellyroll fold domain-containing protein [Prosthecobacter fusiformis]|uniref:LamG-like jellyroll fold domain-containing protein n=1 Tax=Prosthecobacter fusiformis TaxID=48464 RepID=UPI0014150552|nr:LamG-like jellyroll fold domain-containing protein [Prosthecobacter fusiformis]
MASLLFLISTTILAQVEPGPDSPGLDSGVLGRLDHTQRKHDDGDVLKSFTRAVDTEDLKLDHFSLSFQLFTDGQQPRDAVPLVKAEHFQIILKNGTDLDLQISTPAGAKLDLNVPLPANELSKAEMHHIVLRVRREARQSLTGLWVDGVELASGPLAPGAIPLAKGSLMIGDNAFRGVVSDVRLYDRALSRLEILELGQKIPVKSKSSPKDMYNFEIMKDEVIAVLGGTEAVAVMEEGSLESVILLGHADKHPKMRSLAWETDTVFRQDRPLNFGDLRQQLQRTTATCTVMMFGRQECLERGEEGLADFREALNKMVKACAEITPRLVLVEAAPFEKKAAPLRDLSLLNPVLVKYNEVIREIAQAHGAYYAGSSEGWNHARPQPMTMDGVNLTQSGAREVGLRVLTTSMLPESKAAQELKADIMMKNKLWHDYWRPSNWAFLHGDRTSQPSSRDHLDPRRRWFPAELEKYQALIKAKENELWKKAEELGRKLP